MIEERDSSNAILWVSSDALSQWKFQFHFKRRLQLSHMQGECCRVNQLANSMADTLAKQGVDRTAQMVASIL